MKNKKCKSCEEAFTPKAMGQHCCSLPCSIAYDKTKKKARKPKKATKRKGGGVKRDKYDALFSDLVRLRANYVCESCGYNAGGKSQKIQCAHIISRKYKLTRYHPDNAFCLCATCHMNFTDHPLLFADFVREKQGNELPDIIREIAYSKRKVIKAEWEDMQQDYLQQYKDMKYKRDSGNTDYIDFIYPL